MGWPSVNGVVNGDLVEAGVLNRPLYQLAERTEYLRQQLSAYGAGTVYISSAELSTTDTPSVGDVVYRTADGSFAKARAQALQGDVLYADRQAMAIGVVSAMQSDTTASIVLSGKVSINKDVSSLISDAAVTSGGRYYLSDDPRGGKVTSTPKGPVIYVGDYRISGGKVVDIIVSPQYHDFGSSHTHRAFRVSGMPMGSAAYVDDTSAVGNEHLVVRGMLPDGAVTSTGPRLLITGGWYTTDSITYEFTLAKPDGTAPTSPSELSSCKLTWGTESRDVTVGADVQIEHGMHVRVLAGSGTSYSGSFTWTVPMPEYGQRWYTPESGDEGSLACNLNMYPEMAKYVPPVPNGAAALVVDGVEALGGDLFDTPQWKIAGNELVWCGSSRRKGSNTASGPFAVEADGVHARNVVFYTARSTVGPTGFVTSLSPIAGSPLKVVAANTASAASNGDLQIGLDVDFTSRDNTVAGYKVVKAVHGSVFELGPVVERVVGGAGVSVTSTDADGHGTVIVSAGDGMYSGDFETVALENAKQDLAGGVFPYTKLLGWNSTSGTVNINTAFTAKFRVPDQVYDAPAGYNVVLVASVFGESDDSADSYAGIELSNYVLPDQAFSSRSGAASFSTGLSAGQKCTVSVPFSAGYVAFDPITMHGLAKWSSNDTSQRRYASEFLLRNADGVTPVVVHPGWFVGVRIARCSLSSVSEYRSPLGFMSLRWSLVQA